MGRRKRITNDLIRSLRRPAQGNRVCYDGEIPGFGVRVTAAGAVSFVLNYRVHGRERRYTIGKHPELSPEAARNNALQLRNAIREGSDPLTQKLDDRATPTVVDLAAEYMARHATPNKRERSVQDDVEMIDGIITPQLGRLRVDGVHQQELEDLHRRLQATPYRANRVRALLSKMFSLAILWGRKEKRWACITENPARGVQKYPEQKRDCWLNEDELARVRVALKKVENQRDADAVRLILLTGARKREVLSATWEQFDIERGMWTKPSHHTKQKKTEHVPLGMEAVELLKRLRSAAANGSQYLFPGRHHGEHLQDVRHIWKEVRTAAAVERVRVHDLRHSFASHLVSSGVSLPVVGGLLGHTQPQTTARYAHLADTPLRAAADRFGEIFKKSKQRKKESRAKKVAAQVAR